jgi:hypothetical protein
LELAVNLSKTGAASKFTGKIEAFLEEYLITDTEDGSRPVPFGGREYELEVLDSWLNDERAPPRFIFVAPAGRGKSAVLVHWFQQKARIQYSEQWHVVFVPISIRFSTNLPSVFYEAISARLSEIVGTNTLPPPAGTDVVAYYEDQCRLLLDKTISQKIRTLLILDGVDEALGGRFSADWFPREPGPRLRLLLSARLQVGDQDAGAWLARLGWKGRARAYTRELPPLDYQGIQDLLYRAGAPVDGLASRPEIIKSLCDLTGGEPLLLRLYVEDIWKRSGDADCLRVEDLNRIRPGFGGYFSDWLGRQREVWQLERIELGAQIDEAVVFSYLIVLACAYGPLTGHEINVIAQRIHELPLTFRVETTLHPLRRFVIGIDSRGQQQRGGYVLSHPKFGEFLREEYFDQIQIERTRKAIADWGRDILNQLDNGHVAPENASPYLLQYLGQHFEDVGASAYDFFKFVKEAWR